MGNADDAFCIAAGRRNMFFSKPKNKGQKAASGNECPEIKELDPHGASAHQREKVLAEKKIPSLVLSFAIPTMIGMMVNAVYNVVDRFWIGKMENGAVAMAGVGLTMPLTTIAFSFMALIGIGSTALISIRLGEKKRQEAELVLGNCASFSFILGTIITILGLMFAEPLLRLFGASDKTLPFALDYVYVLLAVNTFNTLQFAMSSVMRGVGHPTWSVMTQVTGAVANMVLDPFFIFKAGNIKFAGMQLYMPFGLNMGVRGAAVATAIAQLISFGIVLFYYSRGKSPVRLHLRNLRPRVFVLAKISAIGSSSFALQCAASLVQIIANLQLARHGGDLAISAMTLVNSVAMFCILPIIGIVQGIQPIIGYNYGAKNYLRVRQTFFFAVILTSCLTITASAILQSFPGQLVAMFNDDPGLVALTSKAMRLVLFMLPLLGFQIVSANLFQFIGKSFVSLVMTLLRQIILLIPLYFILPHFMGLQGVWLASPISDAASILITVAVISRELHWLNRKIKQQKIQFVNEGLD